MSLAATIQLRNDKQKIHDFMVLDDQEKALMDKKNRKEKVKSMIICMLSILISILVINLI